MSFLGKWFKKDKQERLDKQTDVDVDAEQKIEKSKKPEIDRTEIKSEKKKEDAKKAGTKKDEEEKVDAPMMTLKTPDYMSNIIKRLHVTEKAADAESQSVYTFVVDMKATKNEIAKEIKRTYNVTPEKIRVMNMRGKRVRWGRNRGQRSGWRKAMVALKKGEKINLHEGT